MSTQTDTDGRRRAGHADVHVLLAEAHTSEAALHTLYRATAPHLAAALAVTEDVQLTEEVLIRTYGQVCRRPPREVLALTDDAAAMDWLLRIALVELVSLRRLAPRPTRPHN